jgi:hypothetical protein
VRISLHSSNVCGGTYNRSAICFPIMIFGVFIGHNNGVRHGISASYATARVAVLANRDRRNHDRESLTPPKVALST